MQKPADTAVPVHDLIASRWSPRAFQPRSIPAVDLAGCFEAARWAASCFNEQPWHFVLATRDEPERFQALLGCLAPFNQAWAAGAAALVLSVAREQFAHNGKPNAHAWYDTGQATAQLVLQATARGLAAHQMAGFNQDAARAACELPAGHAPVAVTALGYAGEPDALPPELAERERAPRARRSLAEQLFAGAFGAPHELADPG